MWIYSRSQSLQALELLAGRKPSKAAARLSLVDWLLVVLLGTVTSVSSLTVAVTDATVALRIVTTDVSNTCCNAPSWWMGGDRERSFELEGRHRHPPSKLTFDAAPAHVAPAHRRQEQPQHQQHHRPWLHLDLTTTQMAALVTTASRARSRVVALGL